MAAERATSEKRKANGPPDNSRAGRYHSGMKIMVDFDVCASTGACTQEAPEVFEVRADGYLYVLQEEPGEDLRSKVESAAELCPTGAISILD